MRILNRVVLVGLALVGLTASGAYGQGASRCAPPTSTPPNNYTPAAQCQLRSSHSSAAPGQTIRLNGNGYRANSNVDIVLHSDPIKMAVATANPGGTFTLDTRIPAAASLGTHRIVASGVDPAGNPMELSTVIQVVAAGNERGRSGDTLPRTGESSVPLTAGGAALVLLGVGMVFVVRHRRHSVSA